MPIEFELFPLISVQHDRPKGSEKEHISHSEEWLCKVWPIFQRRPLFDQINTMPILRFDSLSPARYDSFLKLMHVVQLHITLDFLQLDARAKTTERVLQQLNILTSLNPYIHHALELLNNHVFLHTSNRGAF